MAVGREGARSAVVAAMLVAVSPIAIVPHVVEDATVGALDRFGIGSDTAALIVGIALAVQFLFAFACLRHRRWGYGGVLVLAALWVLLAVVDHPAAFLPGQFRAGWTSRLSVWALVAVQGAAALAAVAALRSTRQTSFRGTGRFNV